MTTWKDRLEQWMETQLGTAGCEMKLENLFDQELTTLFARIEEMIESETEYPARIWSKSLMDVELSIALDGLETFKKELITKLHTLKQEYGVEKGDPSTTN